MARRTSWLARRPVPACELGVLHAFGPGSLHSPNKQLEFHGSNERRLRVPLRGLTLVCLYGPVRVSAGAIRLITDAGAALAYFSADGLRSNGTLQPATDAWKGRRYRQFRAVQDRDWMLEQARQLVAEKIDGMETALAHYQRHGRGEPSVAELLRSLPALRHRAQTADDHAALRGFEGIASRHWFEVLDLLLPEGWSLRGRRKRPPTDAVNALLSLGYTLLFHRVQAACTAWGLDPALGVYHEYRPGRSSLACDLMEPFRVPAVDRLVLQALARQEIHREDFVQGRDLSVRLTDDGWKRWLGLLEAHIHSAAPARTSLQTALVERVRRLAESLPRWEGGWNSPTALEESDAGIPEDS